MCACMKAVVFEFSRSDPSQKIEKKNALAKLIILYKYNMNAKSFYENSNLLNIICFRFGTFPLP